jgi:hypothetical protein
VAHPTARATRDRRPTTSRARRVRE